MKSVIRPSFIHLTESGFVRYAWKVMILIFLVGCGSLYDRKTNDCVTRQLK